MKYILESFKYSYKRFLKLSPLVFLISLAFSLIPKKYVIFDFLYSKEFFKNKNLTFADYYYGISNINKIETLYLILFLIFGFSIISAIIGGLIERDMRTGEFSYKYTFKALNINLLRYTSVIIILVILVEMYLFFVSIAIYASVQIFFNYVHMVYLSITLVMVLLTVLEIHICIRFVLILPETNTTRETLIKSLPKIFFTKKLLGDLKLLFATSIPIIFSYVMMYLASKLHNVNLRRAIIFVLMFIILIYGIPLMYVIYYDINKLPREDKIKEKLKIKNIIKENKKG